MFLRNKYTYVHNIRHWDKKLHPASWQLLIRHSSGDLSSLSANTYDIFMNPAEHLAIADSLVDTKTH